MILLCLETKTQIGVILNEKTDLPNGTKISRIFLFFYFPATCKSPKNISEENVLTDDQNIFIQTFPRLNDRNLRPMQRFLGGDS